MKNLAYSLLAFSLMPAAFAFEQDLLETYTQALQNDPTLQQADAARMATRQGVPIAGASLLPQINLRLHTTSSEPIILSNSSVPSAIQTDEIIRTHGYEFSASQSLFDYGIWSNIIEAQRIADQADATYVAAEQDLIIRVSEAYFDVLESQDNLTFDIAQEEALASQLEQTQQRFNVGLVAITDVNDFQAQYDAQTAQVISSQFFVQDAKESLTEITGLPVDTLAPLMDNVPLHSPDPADMNEWVVTAERNNPSLMAAQYSMQAAQQNIQTTRADHYPNLEVKGGYEIGRTGHAFNYGGDSDDGWAIIVESNMNLFSGGGIYARVTQSQYEYEEARKSLEATRRATASDTRTSYRAVEAAMSQVLALRQAVVSAQSALDANEASYEVGVATSVDVLASISNLYQQKSALANARYIYVLSILQLKQAAGTLSGMDLLYINDLLIAADASIDAVDNSGYDSTLDSPSDADILYTSDDDAFFDK